MAEAPTTDAPERVQPTCSGCRYFDPISSHRPAGGHCRVNPPNQDSRWPAVEAYEWCGRHSTDTPDFLDRMMATIEAGAGLDAIEELEERLKKPVWMMFGSPVAAAGYLDKTPPDANGYVLIECESRLAAEDLHDCLMSFAGQKEDTPADPKADGG